MTTPGTSTQPMFNNKPLNFIDQFGRFWSRTILDFSKIGEYDKPECTETDEYSLIEDAPQLQTSSNYVTSYALTVNHKIYDIMRRRVVDIPELNELKIVAIFSHQYLITDNGKCYCLYHDGVGYTIQRHFERFEMPIRALFNGNTMILTQSGRWLSSSCQDMTISNDSPIRCDRFPTVDEVIVLRDNYIVSTIGLFWVDKTYSIHRLTEGPGVIDIVIRQSANGYVATVHAMLEDGRVYTRRYIPRDAAVAYPLPLNNEESKHWKLNEKLNQLNEESKWVKMMLFSSDSIGISNKRGQVFVIGRVIIEDITAEFTIDPIPLEDTLIELDIPIECFAVVESGMRVKSSRSVVEVEQ